MITDEDRINHDLFPGEEGSVALRTVSIKKARKVHDCFLGLAPERSGVARHQIQPGERYRHEKALIDGDFWGEYKCCLNCVDREIKLFDGEDEDDE